MKYLGFIKESKLPFIRLENINNTFHLLNVMAKFYEMGATYAFFKVVGVILIYKNMEGFINIPIKNLSNIFIKNPIKVLETS